ncbi:hypothetical protein EZY14_009145 [Kordia sp. TARA_039_SRF]|nr:hypothetical protein EZY14_009145 [Kordia sp. TARA_039_SRF]
MIGSSLRRRCCCINSTDGSSSTGFAKIQGFITVYNSVLEQTSQAVGYRVQLHDSSDDTEILFVIVYESPTNVNYLMDDLDATDSSKSYYLKILNAGVEKARTDNFSLIQGQTKTIDYQIVVDVIY